MEGVGSVRKGFSRILSPLRGGVCFGAGGGGGGGGSEGLRECGELGSGGGYEDNFLGEEALEGESRVGAEGRFEEAGFGGYEEFLVGDRDGQLGFDGGGEVSDC